MLKGKTESGFEFEVNENIAKDALVLRHLVKMSKDPVAVFDLIDRMAELGLDEKALNEHCTEEDGIVPIDKVSKEVTEIIQACPKGKNS